MSGVKTKSITQIARYDRLRQYFPKRADFAAITEAEVRRMAERLNDRPRKTLGYRAPNDVFCKRRPVALQS